MYNVILHCTRSIGRDIYLRNLRYAGTSSKDLLTPRNWETNYVNRGNDLGYSKISRYTETIRRDIAKLNLRYSQAQHAMALTDLVEVGQFHELLVS